MVGKFVFMFGIPASGAFTLQFACGIIVIIRLPICKHFWSIWMIINFWQESAIYKIGPINYIFVDAGLGCAILTVNSQHDAEYTNWRIFFVRSSYIISMCLMGTTGKRGWTTPPSAINTLAFPLRHNNAISTDLQGSQWAGCKYISCIWFPDTHS